MPDDAARPSMTEPAGSREQGASLPPRLVAREFAKAFAARGMATHPAEIRTLARKFCAAGHDLARVEDLVSAYADPMAAAIVPKGLRNWHGIPDPTGETVVRQMTRGGGDHV